MNTFYFILFLILSYLLGSTPTGYLIVKKKKGIDVRDVGSGATGGTNVGRVLGGKWEIIVGLLDMAKSAIPVWIANSYFHFLDWQIALVILSAVLGHIYPIFLKFRGGKGVATTIGAFLPLFGWKFLVFIVLIFIPIIYFFKITSFASLVFASFLPFFLFTLTYSYNYLFLGLAICAIIWWTHRENIKRIAQGREKKSGLL